MEGNKERHFIYHLFTSARIGIAFANLLNRLPPAGNIGAIDKI
jgi:hypothetical protein